jgi:uncharacterized protein YqgV (UPF0045/DUF77 family)
MELSDKKPSRFISVEISYYPLNEEYKIPIKDFISRMKSYEILNVRTNTMSTQIFGEYDDVMLALTAEINKSFDLPHSVFVLKIINADLR